MDLSAINWGTVGSIVTVAGTVCTGAIAIAQRHRISEWFEDRKNLNRKLRHTEQDRDYWRGQALEARSAAQFAVNTGAFTRAEAIELLGRVEKLEQYVPKFEAAIAYIKTLLAHCNLIEMWAQRNGHNLPQAVPKPPAVIIDDIGN